VSGPDPGSELLRELRRAYDAGPPDELDGSLRQLGLLYAGVPEPLGAGGDPTLPLLVVAECARHLSSPSWLLTGVLAAQALTALPEPPGVLEPLLDGQLRASVCWPGVLGSEASALDGTGADVLVVVRTRRDGSAEVVLARPGVVLEGLDPTRPLVDVAPADATPLGRLDPEAARSLRAFWLLATAADCLGTMQASLDLGLAHVRDRQAFGRPIGSFQAVRHRCVDLYVDVETTRASVAEGGLAWAAGADDALVVALVAASHGLEAVVRVAEGVVLLHGAMGFTREVPAQGWLRRAYATQALAPPVGVLRRELATA
jgi:alkylation response protein AidB-like acyl-CoA dehydrogenase